MSNGYQHRGIRFIKCRSSELLQEECKESTITVRHSLGNLLQRRDDAIEQAFDKEDHAEAVARIRQFVLTTICDPTVGGGSFLKEGFRQFADPFWFAKLQSWYSRLDPAHQRALTEEFRWIHDTMSYSSFENHVLNNCLYGLDIDLKALSVASQTLTLEALSYLEGEEKFPNFINANLKLGNAFISMFEGEEWKSIPRAKVAKLIEIRKKARTFQKSKEVQQYFDQERLLITSLLPNVYFKRKSQWDFDPLNLAAFCWELEFPEIYFNDDGSPKEHPGFDCIVGNPPWENIKTSDSEFFEAIDQEWPAGKNKKAEQVRRKAALLKDSSIKRMHASYLLKTENWIKFLDASNQYELLSPKFEELTYRKIDENTYKLAAESYVKKANSCGVFGFLIPSGFAGDLGARDLRKNYLKNRWLDLIVSFNEANEIFPDATQSFMILVGSKTGRAERFVYVQDRKTRGDLAQLDIQMPIGLSYELLNKIKLESQPLISAQTPVEEQIIRKIFKFNSPIDSESPWPMAASRELDTTDDMYLTEGVSSSMYSVVKGESIDRYCSPTSSEYKLNYKVFQKDKPSLMAKIETDRAVWRGIAGTNLPRRMTAAIVPAKNACFNSLRVISGPPTKAHLHYVVGVLNSFIYEYFIRLQSKNNNINTFLILVSPFPRLEPGHPKFQSISDLSKQLHRNRLTKGDRIQLEARIETEVALLYGLSNEEFSFVLNSFDKVDRDYRNLVYKIFVELGAKQKAA